ncbi:translocation/assembly module TamB domain-containing protein [Pedobacter lusitanus]|uniref:translocation/assembly module TamB domain-containing protein n=1 Tax=Pedobacter lusitanus TaxID=1503925 RepID=UPI00069779A4|nr:translocation/assembly module TamB domain-containing protein [Pedobacter lusitanus]
MNKYVRKSLKVILWVIASIIFLVVAIAVSLNIPAVQNFVKNKAIAYLKDKTHTEVSLESIRIALPKDIVLNKFYMEDKKGDTLLYAQKLSADISLFKLLSNKVEVNNIELEKIRANVTRINPDTTFNFSFLLDAFMSEQKKPEEQVKQDTTSTMKFSVSKISLKDIGIVYRDDVAGNDVSVNIGEFQTDIKDFDLDKQHYVIKDLILKNTSLKYLQQKPLTQLAAHLEKSLDTAKTTTGKLPLVEIQDVAFNNVKINFNDMISAMRADLNINELNLKKLFADLTKSDFKLDEATLNKSNILFAFKPLTATAGTKSADSTAKPSSLAVLVNKLSLSGNNVQYDNLAVKHAPRGLDYNHLKVNNLGLTAEALSYNTTGIKVNVKSGIFKEKSGFELSKLQGDVIYSDKMIKLTNLVFKTPNTTIENSTSLNYTSLDDLTKHPGKVKLTTQFKNSVLGLKDGTYFSDAIPADYRNEKIKITARVNGYMNNLSVPQLQISGLKSTNIDVNGTVKGLPDVNKTFLDLNIKRFSLTRKDLLVVIPKKSLPANIELPNSIAANGKFKGSMTDFSTDFNINTDMGAARLLATMKGPKGKESYTANINLNNFNAGRLLKMQPQLGKISVKAIINGTGLDAKTAHAKINAQLLSAYYNKYTYKNLLLSGTYSGQKMNIKSEMADTNANFNLTAFVDMAGKYPAVKADLDLKQVDLQKLNFSTTGLSMAGLVKADIKTADPDYLNGDINIRGLQLVKEGQRFNVDTINVHAEATAAHTLLTLKSELLSARVDGQYQLTNLAPAMINQINKYYAFGQVTKIPDQRFRFSMNIYNPKFIKNFVPELTTFSPSRISGLLDTKKDSLVMNAWIPQIVYGDYKIDSTRLKIDNADQKLNYKLLVKSLQSKSIALYNTELSGEAANNILDVNIFLRDSKLKDKYRLGGTFKSINKDFRFSFDPGKLLLNYDKWTVSPENFIQFGASGILANQFNLSRGSQLLGINSLNSTPNSPVKVEFKDFKIETLTKFAEQDSSLVGGAINGTVDVKELMSNPKFEANLTVDHLRYQKDQLGTLRIAVNNNTENAYETNIALTGVHELRVNGFYYTKAENALDLTVNIDKIDLKALESVSMGQIKQGSGTVTGQLSVKGSIDAPKVLGDVKFNQAAFNATYVNSYFRMPNETISFTEEGLKFNNFTVIDSLNQKATINGGILTKNYKDFRFNMDIKTDNFRALNSTSADNEMIYGTVFLTSQIKVRGDLNQPDVNMTVKVEKGTKFFFAMPADDPSVISQEGIVQFIDADAPPFNGHKALKADSISKAPIKGFNLSANIRIDPEAELNVVVDPANGDNLKVRGTANLIATMDPSGKTSLTGRYEVTDGSYNLSIGGIAKKSFKLVKGSSIVWTGDPMEANVDLTALYEVNAAPIDLLGDPSQTLAKTKLPFQVYLMMKDQLMKPAISFRLDLPENERGALNGEVYTKLQNINRDEGLLNKQVFALLALGRFMADNPFESLAGGGGVSSIARSSVSSLLTQQLNNLASDLVKGVDINFGLNSSEDYSTGSMQQKTDLEVGLSKKLLNDRLTVTVGSSFGLEGPQAPGQNSTNIAGNVNVEYALSADGRYRLRAYRRNQNEGVIEGQIIETGVGFALVVDYNKFREIFQKRRKRNQIKTEQKPKNETIMNSPSKKNN